MSTLEEWGDHMLEVSLRRNPSDDQSPDKLITLTMFQNSESMVSVEMSKSKHSVSDSSEEGEESETNSDLARDLQAGKPCLHRCTKRLQTYKNEV